MSMSAKIIARIFHNCLSKSRQARLTMVTSRSLCVFQRDYPLRLNQVNNLLIPSFSKICSLRYKSKTSKKKPIQYDDDDSDDEEEAEDHFDPEGGVIKKFNCPQLRIDLFMKKAFGVSRGASEVQFYSSNIRLNDRKVKKKSVTVTVGDVVDHVQGFSEDDTSQLVVQRAEVLKVAESRNKEALEVTVRHYRSLVIYNYPGGDPWKQFAEEVQEEL